MFSFIYQNVFFHYLFISSIFLSICLFFLISIILILNPTQSYPYVQRTRGCAAAEIEAVQRERESRQRYTLQTQRHNIRTLRFQKHFTLSVSILFYPSLFQGFKFRVSFTPFLSLYLSSQAAMDRYQKVEKPKPESPINENEIRITTQGAIRNYITYATSLLQVLPHIRFSQSAFSLIRCILSCSLCFGSVRSIDD